MPLHRASLTSFLTLVLTIEMMQRPIFGKASLLIFNVDENILPNIPYINRKIKRIHGVYTLYILAISRADTFDTKATVGDILC